MKKLELCCCCKTPIAISLSTDKELEIIKYEGSNICFKYDGDICKKTSWVGPQDGILFYDYDGHHKADDSSKIVLTSWSKNAKTDFQALLEAFDTNKDKLFDEKDVHYQNFYLWQDKNSNAVVDKGELRSLKEIGIKAIDFTTTQVAHEEELSDGILNKADVIWESGKVTKAYDLVFVHDL